jgi:glutamyl-Q tRNA(Asp) synthetase
MRPRGRFAPSPTGPLHQGSLVAALASWLDARAQGGQWLVRIEDVDTPRCVPGAAEHILQQLARCGLHPDEPPLWQSTRHEAYEKALAQLVEAGLAYPCSCSRQDIARALAAQGLEHQRHGERVYPGTCRQGLQGGQPRAWRLRTDLHPTLNTPLTWHDRRLGAQHQCVSTAVGDIVLKRADGLWAYQLAVVVDDAAQGITHIVRGEDLADNTARQIGLQQCLGLPTPQYLHTPLVLAADGHKLSKQNGAAELDLSDPLAALQTAAAALGLPPQPGASTANSLADWLAWAVSAWANLYVRR